MGGSSKGGSPTTPGTGTPAQAMPQMLTFGGDNALLAQQLQAGGLLGAVGNPSSFYQPVTVPLIENPSMLQAYMHSKGMPYQANDGTTVAPPAKPTTGLPGGTPTKPTTGGVVPRVLDPNRRRGSDR